MDHCYQKGLGSLIHIFLKITTQNALLISPLRIGDHRRETGLGGELAVDQHPAGELADLAAVLDEIDLDAQQNADITVMVWTALC